MSPQPGNQTVSHSSLKHSFSEMKCVAVDPVYTLNNVLQKKLHVFLLDRNKINTNTLVLSNGVVVRVKKFFSSISFHMSLLTPYNV